MITRWGEGGNARNFFDRYQCRSVQENSACQELTHLYQHNGTTSDFDGNFTITVADENSTLVFSYIGFITQEVAADSDSYNITMISGADELQEVVVTGYGTQRKATLTGSVAAIGGDELEKSSSPNLGTALAGKVLSGLLIVDPLHAKLETSK